MAGKALPELLSVWGDELVGRLNSAATERGRFPILIKLLDAAEWLSVQVHPDDTYALEHEGDLGKTEMWIVLHADPGAQLIQGFKPGVQPHQFAAAISAGGADEFLRRVSVTTGDVFFLRPGTIHAVGPGILLTEIQQSSDVTYRVYDWDRDGEDRPLHLSRALDVLDFNTVEPCAVQAKWHIRNGIESQLLASCPYFETRRLELGSEAVFEGRCDGATFEAWAVIGGHARLGWAGGALELDAVQWVLLPAALGDFNLTAADGATLLQVITPEPESR